MSNQKTENKLQLKLKLEEIIFTALGTASVCWSEAPKGIFDSTQAKIVGDEAVEKILLLIPQSSLATELAGYFEAEFDSQRVMPIAIISPTANEEIVVKRKRLLDTIALLKKVSEVI